MNERLKREKGLSATGSVEEKKAYQSKIINILSKTSGPECSGANRLTMDGAMEEESDESLPEEDEANKAKNSGNVTVEDSKDDGAKGN